MSMRPTNDGSVTARLGERYARTWNGTQMSVAIPGSAAPPPVHIVVRDRDTDNDDIPDAWEGGFLADTGGRTLTIAVPDEHTAIVAPREFPGDAPVTVE